MTYEHGMRCGDGCNVLCVMPCRRIAGAAAAAAAVVVAHYDYDGNSGNHLLLTAIVTGGDG